MDQGPWARLEQAARNLALQDGVEAVYGMTALLYDRRMPQLPRADEPHLVPSGYWKILAIQDGSAIKAAAFIMDQDTPRNAEFRDHLTTIDEIERRSGLNFYHALSQSEQDPLESRPGVLAVQLGCTP